MKQRLIGIDFSLTSTGICEKSINLNGLEEIKFYWFGATSHPKKRFKELEDLITVKSFERKQLKDYNEKCVNDIIQASNLAYSIIDTLQIKQKDIIGIEGFSLNSIGNSVYDLVQYQSILRHEIAKINDNFNVFAPAEIKKFFFGKGNASKLQMIETGIKNSTQIAEINKKLSFAKPIDDLVDAYAIMKILENKIK